MLPLLKAWMVWERYGSLLPLCYPFRHVRSPAPSPRVPPKERSESKWLRHSIQFQPCFYLICSSLRSSWKGVCNLESKFLSKKRCLGWQTGCLSVYHPPLFEGPHSAKIRHKGNSLCSHFLLEFCKTREISKEKDNSRDSKMKLACHAERGTQ